MIKIIEILTVITLIRIGHGEVDQLYTFATAPKNASCDWKKNTNLHECIVYCSVGDIKGIGPKLTELWDLRIEQCQTNGMELILSSNFVDINQKLEKDWLMANISLVKLEITLSMASIAPNAFVGKPFETIKELIINGGGGLSKDVLEFGVFNGLDTLQSLKMLKSSFHGFDYGLLDSIRKTLKYLELTALSPTSPIEIMGLTGGEPMIHLQTVKINVNLQNIINSETFIALTNVTELNLADCHIESIGSGAFDRINPNIKILNLSRRSTLNGIRHIADKLFDTILQSNSELEIKLDKNNWNCECDINYLKKCLNMYPTKFSGEFKCQTPQSLFNYNISTVKLINCDSIESTTETTTATSTTPTTVTTTTTEDDGHDLISQECTDNNLIPIDNVNIKPRQQIMKVIDLKNGSVNIEIEYIKNDLFLIWFNENNRLSSQKLSINNLDCIALQNESIIIDNFMQNTPYTICLMNNKAVTVSPFDCISFITKYSSALSDQQHYIWLTLNVRPISIGLAVLGFILSILLGIIIGIVAIRKYPNLLGDHKRIIRVNSRLGCSQTSSGILVMPNEYKRNETLPNNSSGLATIYGGSVKSSNCSAIFAVNNATQRFSEYEKPPPLPPYNFKRGNTN